MLRFLKGFTLSLLLSGCLDLETRSVDPLDQKGMDMQDTLDLGRTDEVDRGQDDQGEPDQESIDMEDMDQTLIDQEVEADLTLVDQGEPSCIATPEVCDCLDNDCNGLIDQDQNGTIEIGELQNILGQGSMSFSDNVLDSVMKKSGIDDREAFVAFAIADSRLTSPADAAL